MQATMIKATVTDTNRRDRGVMSIELETTPAGIPVLVKHDGREYARTGKDGFNLTTGLKVYEMATADDARIWVTADGRRVFED